MECNFEEFDIHKLECVDMIATPSPSPALSLVDAPTSVFPAVPVEFNVKASNRAIAVHPLKKQGETDTYYPAKEASVEKVKEDKEEGKGILQKSSPKKVREKTKSENFKPAGPVGDKVYFDVDYKAALKDYWLEGYEKDKVLGYMNNWSKDARGVAYQQFVPALYKLQQEYLSPGEFMKHENNLFKWVFTKEMPQSIYSGVQDLLLDVKNSICQRNDLENDLELPDGCSLTMYLVDQSGAKPCWKPWIIVQKSQVQKAGNGLFAAREFQVGQIIGFYVGYVVYKYDKRWTEKVSDEYLVYKEAILDDDSRTMLLVDKMGYRVMVNPYYGVDRTKLKRPSLLMGMQFLNDFTKVYRGEAMEDMIDRAEKTNNVWVDDQGGVRAKRRIMKGSELFLSYAGMEPLLKKKKPKDSQKVVAGSGPSVASSPVPASSPKKRKS